MESEDQNSFAAESLCPGHVFRLSCLQRTFLCSFLFDPWETGETLPPTDGKIGAQNSSVTPGH